VTPEQARLELDATTLRPQDASEETRAMVESDPQLGAWAAARTDFDQRVANAMDDIPVPGDLHLKLLAMSGQRAPAPRKVMPRAFMWLAAAAAFLMMFFGWWWQSSINSGWQSEALANVKLIDLGMARLQHESESLNDLKHMLAAEGSLSPGQLPASLAALKTYGCRVIKVAGKPATVVCFELPTGDEAHLVVMNHNDVTTPLNAPAFSTKGGWTMASWSDGQQSYMLATRADAKQLKKLFA